MVSRRFHGLAQKKGFPQISLINAEKNQRDLREKKKQSPIKAREPMNP